MKHSLILTFLTGIILAGCSPKITTVTMIEQEGVSSDHPDYAVIHLYRGAGMITSLNYDVHIGEEKVFRAKINSKTEVKIYDEGEVQVWAKTESRNILPLNVRKGKDYYVSCDVLPGLVIGRPDLRSMSEDIGKVEYMSIDNEVEAIMEPGVAMGPVAPKWRFSVQGGYGYRMGKMPEDMNQLMTNHVKSLKDGFAFEVDATYYFLESFGIGMKYSGLHVGNKEEHVTVSYDDGRQESGIMEDKINISFAGPFASYRYFSNNMNHCIILNYGIGYMGYKDKAVLINPFTLKGNTLGTVYEIGYEYRLNDRISLGGMLSSYSGTITKMQTNYGGAWKEIMLEDESYESLTHYNFTIGLRINL